MEVVPDRTVGETSVAQGMASIARNGLYEAVAGETGWYHVKVAGICSVDSFLLSRALLAVGCTQYVRRVGKVHAANSTT